MSWQRKSYMRPRLDKKKYAWNEKWIHEYESAWSILEKFKAANVFTTPDLNKIVKLSNSPSINPKLYYNSSQFIYHYRSYDDRYLETLLPDYNLDKFHGLESVTNHKIRFCKKCIANGYHSVYHQLDFLDYCFIHKDTKLEYLCDCSISYVIKNKNREVQPFQCVCGKRLNVPETTKGILGLWEKPIIKLEKNDNV